jgi:cell division protease FtsH
VLAFSALFTGLSGTPSTNSAISRPSDAVFSILLGVLATISPMDPVPRHDCSKIAATSTMSKSRAAASGSLAALASTPSSSDERMSADYIMCEVQHHPSSVKQILFLKGDSAVATMADGTTVQFVVPQDSGAWFAAKAGEKGVKLSSSAPKTFAKNSSTSGNYGGPSIAGIVTLLFSVVFLGFIARRWQQVRNGRKVLVGGSVGFSKKQPSNIPTTTFADVAGCKEAVEDLQEIVEVLKHPERFTAVGARAPKGALLVGPPGTGKTLLARAVAGEAGVPFFSAAGSDFVEMYVGVGARRVRDLFERARKAGGGIVFIDEIDSVGRKRSQTAVSGGEGETENTLISLLNELDGFAASNVVVLAATNRPEILDPALMRPGRLDRRVHVGLPDIQGRAEILEVHMREKPRAADVDLTALARRTPGMSGAQLEQVCNEAALLAAIAARTEVTSQDLASAVEYVVMGRARRSAKVDKQDRLVTAWHEAGHAVCAMLQPDADPPVAVSIIPRGQTGGVTWMSQTDSMILSRSHLRARLVVALGGRVSEELLMDGEHTAGAASDLEVASSLAREMVDRFGMTDRGLAVRPGGSDSSEEAVEALLGQALADARSLLDENRQLVELMVKELLEHDDLDEAALGKLLEASRSLTTPN